MSGIFSIGAKAAISEAETVSVRSSMSPTGFELSWGFKPLDGFFTLVWGTFLALALDEDVNARSSLDLAITATSVRHRGYSE